LLQIAKPNAYLINTGRGAVISEKDLAEALEKGLIQGAALDVVENEPIGKKHPYLTMENVILTPHIAFYTEESLEELKMKTAYNVLDVLQGKRPRYEV